jgi:hypothetical protein
VTTSTGARVTGLSVEHDGGWFADARLQAHRQVLTDAAETLLRRQAAAWSDPQLDDAGRAVAALRMPPEVRLSPPPQLPDSPAGAFTRLVTGCDLRPAEEPVVAAAWWVAVDPATRVLFGAVHDDPTRRFASLAALRMLLLPAGVDVALTIGGDDPLARCGLVLPVSDPSLPVLLTPTATRVLGGWLPAAAAPAALPDRLAATVDVVTDLVGAGRRVVLRADPAADARLVAEAVAADLGRVAAEPGPTPAETELLVSLGVVLPVRGLHGEPAEPDQARGNPPDDGARLVVGDAVATAPPGWHIVTVPALDHAGLTGCWNDALQQAGLPTLPAAELASRLRLTEADVATLTAMSAADAAARHRGVELADLEHAIRNHPRHALAGLAQPLPVTVTLTDLVLSATTRRGLDLLLAHARHTAVATATWKGVRGRGVVALLHGPSGTGKTAAAEALGFELGRDVWAVDLAQVVSKWLGETQRNLDRVLREGSRAGAILLFDEADGLFGRRGEVTDARDRYANLEIDHLLQRVELHDGIVLLTSNRPAALDDAFARRLRLRVRFDLPDHEQRTELWSQLLPPAVLDPQVDYADVARAELSGGGIRAAALAARVLALAAHTAVGWQHLDLAVQTEMDKQGRRYDARAHAGNTMAGATR